MKYLLSSTLLLFICYVAVESVKMVEVSRTRRDFDSHRAKRNTLTLRDISDSLGLGDHVELAQSKGSVFHSASKGVDRIRVEEKYDGLVVKGTVAEVETENGVPTGQMYGHLADTDSLVADIPDSTACMQDVDEMINLAVVAEGFDIRDPEVKDRKGERMIYRQDDTAHIVYNVEFKYFTHKTQKYPVYFIKACDKKVLLNVDKMITADLSRRRRGETTDDTCVDPTPEPLPASNCTPSAVGLGGNPKTGKLYYGQTGRCLQLKKDGKLCTMDNEYVKVIDNEHSMNRHASQNPIVFKCSLGYSDPANEAYGVAVDALYFGTSSIRFFKEMYDTDALPHKPRMVVHYGSDYENAFWDGTDMYFGDGKYRFYPLLDLDVIAHELAHGFTSTNSDLIYSKQSGGINEAFSDITGDTVQNFVYGENDWLIGALIGKQMEALRYMKNPPLDGKSIGHIDDYRDGMDVHYSSGIFNRAYYQLVAVQEMPIFHAFECFMEANKVLWGPNTGFTQGACGVVQACYDEGFDTDKVIAAFGVTGITFEGCDITALKTVMPASDTREIKVSSQRRPIIGLDADGTTVSVTDPDVTLEICSDADCKASSITQTGTGSLDVNSATEVFVRVSSSSEEDTMISLMWE